jgi:hypothetical protein
MRWRPITSSPSQRGPGIAGTAAGLGHIALFWLTWANRSLQGAVGLVTIAIGLHAIVTTTLSKPAHLHSLTLRPALTPANGLHVRLTGRFERPS